MSYGRKISHLDLGGGSAGAEDFAVEVMKGLTGEDQIRLEEFAKDLAQSCRDHAVPPGSNQNELLIGLLIRSKMNF